MKIERAALFDPEQGEFLADRGGGTLELHEIRIFVANEGHDGELRRWMRMFPQLKKVPCEGTWCADYGVKNS